MEDDQLEPIGNNNEKPAVLKRSLKFCPESNDLLYPRENKELRRLEYYCKNCDYVEFAQDRLDNCVYVSELKHDAKEQTVVLSDVMADPTLPRTQDVTCPECAHNEAVFFSSSSEQGMTLYFNCLSCRHRWRDYV
jgi:DNA-directed RNA polymerase II subunit RPB9